jgi:hypothetical protein
VGNFVYKRTDGGNLFTVGHYDPDGRWEPESDHVSAVDAAARVHFLNGGENEEYITLKAFNGFLEANNLWDGK